MHFERDTHAKSFGPLAIPHDSFLTYQQQLSCFHSTGCWAKIITTRATGMWVVPTCTRMPLCCGYRRRPIPSDCHIPSARRGPCARRGIYPIRSARSNPSCRYFSRKNKWRSTGDPRSPDHEQPSRKSPRTLARPATGTSVSPGFPTWALQCHEPAPARTAARFYGPA